MLPLLLLCVPTPVPSPPMLVPLLLLLLPRPALALVVGLLLCCRMLTLLVLLPSALRVLVPIAVSEGHLGSSTSTRVLLLRLLALTCSSDLLVRVVAPLLALRGLLLWLLLRVL